MAAFGGLFGFLTRFGSFLDQSSIVARDGERFLNMFGARLDTAGLDQVNRSFSTGISVASSVRDLAKSFLGMFGVEGIFVAAKRNPDLDVGRELRKGSANTHNLLATADTKAPIALLPVFGTTTNSETVASQVPLSEYFANSRKLTRVAPNIA